MTHILNASLYFLWAAMMLIAPVVGSMRMLVAKRAGIASHVVGCMKEGIINAWHFLWFDAPKSCSDAAILQRVERIQDEQMLVRIQGVAHALVRYVHPIGGLFFSVDGYMHLNGDDDIPEAGGFSLHLVQLLPVLPAQLLVTYCYLRKYSFTRWHFRFVFSCVFFREAIMVLWSIGDITLLQSRLLIVALGQLWVSIAVQDIRFVCRLHVAYILVYITAGFAPGIGCMDPPFCVAMALFKALTCISLLVIEKEAKACIRAGLETQVSQQHSAAANNLLSSMCDAVVELSEDYRVVAGYQKLAVLLLRQDVFAPASPCCFLDIIATESDQEAFKAFVERSGHDGSFAQTAHVTLQDSTATCFPVQLFHAQTVSADKSRIHVIGIRDTGDVSRQPPACNSACSHVDSMLQKRTPNLGAKANLSKPLALSSIAESGPEIAGDAAASRGVEAAESIPMSFKSHSSGSSSGTPASPAGTAAVWMEPLHLKMLGCTLSFANLFGAAAVEAGASFLTLVFPDERLKFWQQFQDATRDMLELDFSDSEQSVETANASFEVSVHTRCRGLARMYGSLRASWAGLPTKAGEAMFTTSSTADCDPCSYFADDCQSLAGSDADIPLIVLTIKNMRKIRPKGVGVGVTMPLRRLMSAAPDSQHFPVDELIHL